MAKRERQENSSRPQSDEPYFSANIHPNHRSRTTTPVKRRKIFEKERSGGDDTPESRNNNSSMTSMAYTMVGEQFRKLDASIPEEDRRIMQRQRAVLKGKNTVGYDEYISQVPKRARTIRHPRTPDHTIDIPNRRWLGLVKSWRIALHKYDPEDLQTEFNAQNDKDEKMKIKMKAKSLTVQEQQIADASTKGLLVDFGATDQHQPTVPKDSVPDEKDSKVTSPAGIVADGAMEELDKLEANCDGDEDFLDYDDSDDDLL